MRNTYVSQSDHSRPCCQGTSVTNIVKALLTTENDEFMARALARPEGHRIQQPSSIYLVRGILIRVLFRS